MTHAKRLRPGINKFKYLTRQMRKERAVPRVTVSLLSSKIMGVGVPKLSAIKAWVSRMSAQDQRNRLECRVEGKCNQSCHTQPATLIGPEYSAVGLCVSGLVNNDFLNSGSCPKASRALF
jgi:hypothetical protein